MLANINFFLFTQKLLQMSEETKTYVFGNDSDSKVPAWMAMNNGGFGGYGNGWGGGIIGFILGILLGNNGLFGGWGNNNGGYGAGYIANQLNNDTGRDLIMQAINGNGDAIRALSTTLNSDFNLVQSALNTISNGITTVGSQVGMSSLQVVNAIQAGNSSLASQLAQCCCENRLLTTQQGYEAQIRTLEQTNQLGAQADRNTNSVINAINTQTIAMNDHFCEIKERELQNKIDALTASNTSLRNQIDNAQQTQQFAAMLAPLQAQVNLIASRQPSTVPVIWPQLTVTDGTTTATTSTTNA